MVVGIGASAGGIAPLCAFFRQIPPKIEASFIVVLHQSPSSESSLDELLKKVTRVPVQRISKDTQLQEGYIYVINPSFDVALEGKNLVLKTKSKTRRSQKNIDTFFVSLAKTQKNKSIAILLSGMGTDGVEGIRAIHNSGGLVLTQSVQEAQFTGIISAANQTGLVNASFYAQELAQEVLENIYNPNKNSSLERQIYLQTSSYEKLLNHIKTTVHVDFFGYKKPTLVRRLSRRLTLKGYTGFEAYLNEAFTSRKETLELTKDLLINVTEFFRDPALWHYIKDELIPKEVNGLVNGTSYKIWCMACSTGEEAYSIAMLFHEEFKRQNKALIDFKIFATDISGINVENASKGIYSKEQLSTISQFVKGSYFQPLQNDKLKIKEEIRRYLVFSEHNLLSSPPFRGMNMVFCRNLLIYLNDNSKEYGLGLAQYSLKKDGFLVLGKSESLGKLNPLFKTVNAAEKIFKNLTKSKSIKSPRRTLIHNGLNTPTQKKSMQSKSNFPSESAMTTLFTKELGFTSIYIDSELNIIKANGDLKKYLELPEDGFSHSLNDLMPNELRTEITLALIQAEKNAQNVTIENVILPNFEAGGAVDVLIIPSEKLEISNDGNFMVVFIPRKVDKRETSFISHQVDNEFSSNVELLQKELAEARTNLLALKQQIAIQKEQLQSSNEELLATNEELQSTNEEQQSTNEELHSVNSELGQKLQELAVANSTIDSILKSTEITTLVLTKDFKLKSITPNIREIFNINPSDLGRSLSDFTHHLTNDTIDELLDNCKKVLKSGKPRQKEVTHQNNKHYLQRITPFINHENQVEGLVVTFVDITAQKEIEYQLRDREAQLNVLFNKSPDITIALNREGKLIRFNEQFLQKLGYDKTESLVGQPMVQFIHEDSHHVFENDFSSVMKGKAIKESKAYLKTKAGEKIPVLADANPIFNEEGKLEFALASLKDISLLENAQKELEETREEYKALFDHAPDMFFAVNEDGIVTNCNNQAAETLEYHSADEIIGKHIAALLPTDFDFKQLEKEFKNVLEGIPQKDLDYVGLTKTGKQIPVKVNTKTIFNPDGSFKSSLGSWRDMRAVVAAEKELEKTRQDYKKLFDNTPGFLIVVDPETRLIDCNDDFIEQMGFENKESLLGKRMSDFMDPESVNEIRKNLHKVLNGEKLKDVTRKFVSQNGEIIIAYGTITPIMNEDGAVKQLIGSFEDITELQKSQNLLQTQMQAFEEATDGFYDWKITENTIYTSKSIKDWFGYEEHEMPNTFNSWRKLMVKEDLEKMDASLEKHFRSKGIVPHIVNERYQHKDGSMVHLQARGKVIEWDENDNPIRMVGSHTNMTKLLKLPLLEQKLVDRNKAFEQVLESTMIGFWDTNFKNGTTYLSPTYKKMFGYEENELTKPDDWQKIMHPEDLMVVTAAFQEHFDSKGEIPYAKELRFFHKEGAIINVWCKGKVIEWDENDQPVRMLGTHVDITPIKKLADSNRELERFAYVASHDLQEPLRTVNDFVKLFKEEYGDTLEKEGVIYLDFIQSAAVRMRNLVTGILEYSKIKGDIKHEKVDLDKVVEEVLLDLQIKIDDLKATVEISELPVINGNAIELHSLFLNLISNALKFVDKNKAPEILIKVSRASDKFQFLVQDNGIGIKPEHQEKIFDIFMRLHSDESFHGTGIGLAHCKKIVELHGGNIWVESKPSKGSKFYFTLKA
ncbi:PAS domain S-box protein [Croceivirga thetidis]|uniref:histidine kinase n=1 Tax=Croceivirga thetidis TaxID=2721623 RepID=A0ABX1GQ83_9FLAO|nr:PAS domain S-box protein [Croceivirga thetidis]NKI31241.1 PAS domain S-box protein [Croceivirga thetidis]